MRKRLLTSVLAGGLLVGMLPVVASAAPSNHTNVFSKTPDNPDCLVYLSVVGHFNREFNPSWANRAFRDNLANNDCGKLADVQAGAEKP